MSASPSHADMIIIKPKLEGCIKRAPLDTRKKRSSSRERGSASLLPVSPGDLSKYYNYAPFYFTYNEPIALNGKSTVKKHIFKFNVGLVASDSNTMLVEKRITYRDFGIMKDADVERITTIMTEMKPSGKISTWFLPFMESIIEMFETQIIRALIDAIQDNTTPDGEKTLTPSEIVNTIKITPTIRRKLEGELIPLKQSIINKVTSGEKSSMDYNIYFTFQMKPDVEPHTTKRILSRFCIKTVDGSEETRYIMQIPSGAYVSTQEEGKPRVYNRAELPFHYVKEKSTTRRRGNRSSK